MSIKHKLILIATIIVSTLNLNTLSAFVPTSDMRFHCDSDTIIIDQLLHDAKQKKMSSNDLIIYFAEKFIDSPYCAWTLESSTEQLTVNIHSFDCMTLIDCTLALAKSCNNSNPTWRNFADNLESIRYRRGEISGYASRLHYTSDWIADNIYRGNIIELTSDFKGSGTMLKNLDYMSRHSDTYPALADSSKFAAIQNIELGYRNIRIPYIKKSDFGNKHFIDMLQNGDIIFFVSKENGLDSSHSAIIKIIDGNPHLLHASIKRGIVLIEKESLNDYFKNNARYIPGIRVVRIRN